MTENGAVTTSDLLRLVGMMAVGVGLAWAFQLLAFARVGSAFDQLLWVVGAAAIAGAGVGAIFAARGLREQEDALHA